MRGGGGGVVRRRLQPAADAVVVVVVVVRYWRSRRGGFRIARSCSLGGQRYTVGSYRL